MVTRREMINEFLNQDLSSLGLTETPRKDRSIIKYSLSLLTIPTEVKHLKGVILDQERKPIACSPVIPDDIDNPDIADDLQDMVSGKKCTLTEIIDGVMFRMYFHQGEWCVSTQGMIEPSRGFRGRRSFKELFDEAVDHVGLMKSSLNPHYVYVFMMRHPSEPTVLPVSEIQLYCTAVLDAEFEPLPNIETLEEFQSTRLKFPSCHTVIPQNVESLISTCNNLLSEVGYVTSGPHHLRIERSDYVQKKKLVGNKPDHVIRLVELWKEDVTEAIKFRDLCRSRTITRAWEHLERLEQDLQKEDQRADRNHGKYGWFFRTYRSGHDDVVKALKSLREPCIKGMI